LTGNRTRIKAIYRVAGQYSIDQVNIPWIESIFHGLSQYSVAQANIPWITYIFQEYVCNPWNIESITGIFGETWCQTWCQADFFHFDIGELVGQV